MKKLLMVVLICFGCLVITNSAFAFSFEIGAWEAGIKNYENLVLPGLSVDGDADGITANTDADGNITYFNQNGDGLTDNVGVFYIEEFHLLGESSYWISNQIDGTKTEELTGYFTGIDVQSWSYDASLNWTFVQSVGGTVDVYLDNTPDFDGSIANAINGILFMSLTIEPGVLPLEDTTIDGAINNNADPDHGSARSYLDVVPGSGTHGDYYNSDFWPVSFTTDGGVLTDAFRDVKMLNDFDPPARYANGDPIDPFVINGPGGGLAAY